MINREMKDLFELIRHSDQLLQEHNQEFREICEQVVTLMRALNIIPIRRVTLNNYLHLLMAGILVSAWLKNCDIYMTSRRTNAFVERGCSTRVLAWMDDLVKHGLIDCQHEYKAIGRLSLGASLLDSISRAKLTSLAEIDLEQGQVSMAS
jgi:hypothetical protein